MKKSLLAGVAVLAGTCYAMAADFYVVQDTTTMKCAVISRQPAADDKMKVIGAAHSSQAEAQTALIAYKTCAQ